MKKHVSQIFFYKDIEFKDESDGGNSVNIGLRDETASLIAFDVDVLSQSPYTKKNGKLMPKLPFLSYAHA